MIPGPTFPPEAPCLLCGTRRDRGDGTPPCAARVPIFKQLDDSQLLDIMRVITPKKYPKDSIIFSPGHEANALNIIRKGVVRIYNLTPNGKEKLIRILKPGDFMGETALTGRARHQHFAVALSEVHICSIQRDDFQKVLLQYPEIALRVLAELTRRLEYAENQASEMAVESAETRLARFLLEQAEIGAVKRQERFPTDEVHLEMKRKDIASHLGMTPETLSRKISEFESRGLIRQLNLRNIVLLDKEALEKL